MNKIKELGQVFTPKNIVEQMIKMRKNTGTVLEPSCGYGAFLSFLENYIAIEYDKQYSNPNILNMDFFQFPISNKFDTIIGNPPYVAYKYIQENISLIKEQIYI